MVGAAVAVVLLAGFGVLGVGLITGGQVPLPGWPSSGMQAEHGRTAPTASPDPSPVPEQPVGLVSTAPTASTPALVATPDNPGQGDEHRSTARPTRSAGKPG